MSKFLLSIITLLIFSASFSQDNNYKKRSAIGVSLFLNDFKTAADLRNNGLSSVIRANNLFVLNRMNPGIAVNYLKGISPLVSDHRQIFLSKV